MNIKKLVKEWVISLAIISTTVACYAAISSVTSWSTLTASIFNDLVTQSNNNQAKLVPITNTSGNITVSWKAAYTTETNMWTSNADFASKAYVDAQVWAAWWAFAFTVRGQTTCPSWYSLAYTWEAIFPASSTSNWTPWWSTICKSWWISESGMTNYLDWYWSVWTSNEVQEVILCALCYQ